MGCLRKLTILVLLGGFSPVSSAGVETPLLLETQGECQVRVVHDATPDSTTGTLVLRAFQLIDGLAYACDVGPAQAAASLGRGVAAYLAQGDLKPATSVFVGRIGRYPWVREAWRLESGTDFRSRLDTDAFNALVGSEEIARPFTEALRMHGLEPGGASCEKLMFHDNGAPMDGLCWILIRPH